MSNQKWDKRFMDVAKLVATWSSCLRRQVGAVIVRNGRIIATGYNGAPSGITSCVQNDKCLRNELNIESGTNHDFCYAAHAEQNAILQAAKLGIPVDDCVMYCTHKPCSICLKLILNAGIKELIYLYDYADKMSQILTDSLQYSSGERFKLRQYIPLNNKIISESMTHIDICTTLLNSVGYEDADVLIAALAELHYFDAPASCSHHLAYSGGLAEHSINVALNLQHYTETEKLVWQKKRSPIIIGLLHDLCKCDQYVKLSTSGYAWNKSADARHGIKSLEIAKALVNDLTEEEAACIEHHMGAFTDKSQWNAYSSAARKYSNVIWTHQADMVATNVNEIEVATNIVEVDK